MFVYGERGREIERRSRRTRRIEGTGRKEGGGGKGRRTFRFLHL